MALGDLNGDGKLDLVIGNVGSDTVSVLVGTGDGKLDLAGASASGIVSGLPGKGDGTFAAGIEQFVEADLSALALGDLNGDGMPDIVVTSSGSDTWGVLLNTCR